MFKREYGNKQISIAKIGLREIEKVRPKWKRKGYGDIREDFQAAPGTRHEPERVLGQDRDRAEQHKRLEEEEDKSGIREDPDYM